MYKIEISGNKMHVEDVYGSTYFPRYMHYLKDARKLANHARELKAQAKITDKHGNEKKF